MKERDADRQKAQKLSRENQQLLLENLEEGGGVCAEKSGERFHCIPIIGQIEGHYFLPEGQKATKYEQILPLLVSLEEDEAVDGILMILNTMGGDVEAGLALAEMIASMTKPTVSLVLGGGHSIGVPLATAAKYSLIVPSATMTLHPVRVSGMVVGVPQSFRYMSEMQKRIVTFICDHSRAEPEQIHALMMRPDQIATDCGSIIEGREAVEYGILDEVGGLDRALAVLREMAASGAVKHPKNKNKNNTRSKNLKKKAEKQD
ncbi:MAG: ATP-dependent Clp protease proteolytic subunit [Clostridia bacterium]|nr:ATP-dependent Clp protease proteolytic subunit [Clostridia bacterium]